MDKVIKCPTCGNSVTWNKSSPTRPFCSDRCRLIDLGEWASESHRIDGDPADFTQLPESLEK